MACHSLSTSRIAGNDLKSLAKIFETNLNFYCNNSSPMEKDYLKEIKTIVGLGFTLALVEGDVLSIYQYRLNRFLEYCDFKKHQGCIPYLCQMLAEMVDLTVWLFNLKGYYPRYYDDFCDAIKKTVGSITSSESGEDVQKILKLILQK